MLISLCTIKSVLQLTVGKRNGPETGGLAKVPIVAACAVTLGMSEQVPLSAPFALGVTTVLLSRGQRAYAVGKSVAWLPVIRKLEHDTWLPSRKVFELLT